MNLKTFFRQIENPNNYNIDNIQIGFLRPEASVNFVYDPEVNSLDNYNGTATLVHDYTKQSYGLASIKVNSMQYLENVTYSLSINLDGNTSYTFSVEISGIGNFELYFASGGIKIGASTTITTNKFWNRYSHTIHLRDGVDRTNISVGIQSVTNGELLVHFDGFQVEAKPYATTFISGTRRGNFAGIKEYYWNGNAHQSASTRLSTTTTGGRIVYLSDMGIDLMGLNGLGMLEVDIASQRLSLKQKSLYNGSNLKERDVELLLNINSADYSDYLQKRNSLISLLNPNKTRTHQPTRIFLTLTDCGKQLCETVYLDVVYESGLSGQYSNLYNERMAINLIAYDPMLKSSVDKTCELEPNFSDTIVMESSIVTNSNVDSEWEEINNISFPIFGPPPSVDSFYSNYGAIGPDGKYYVVGNFQFLYGNPYIARRWNGSSWEDVGSEMLFPGIVDGYDIIFLNNNTAYIAGSITGGTIDGISDNLTGDGINILGYNIQTNTFFKIGEIDGPTKAIATDGNYLYVGGQFNNVTDTLNVTITANSVARYDIANDAWDDMNGGFGFPVITNLGVFESSEPYIQTVAIDKNGIVWFGGVFAVSNYMTNVVRFNPNTDTWMDTEPLLLSTYPISPIAEEDIVVNDIIVNNAGEVYAGGCFDATFTTENTTGVENRLDRPISIAKWNGTTWLPLQALLKTNITPGFSIFPAIVTNLNYDETSKLLYTVGQINYAGQQYNSPYDPNINPYDYQLKNNGYGAFSHNGSSWKAVPLQFGTDPLNFVKHITIGSFFEVGSFTTALSGQVTGYGLPAELQSSLFLGITAFTVPDTFIVPALTECNNSCGDIASPIITIVGPGTFVSIKNLTTDSEISFSNLDLLANDVITIDLSGITPVIIPNSVKLHLNRSSNLTTFRLQSGINTFEVFYKSTTSDSKVYVTYNTQYLSFDAVCGDCQ